MSFTVAGVGLHLLRFQKLSSIHPGSVSAPEIRAHCPVTFCVVSSELPGQFPGHFSGPLGLLHDFGTITMSAVSIVS